MSSLRNPVLSQNSMDIFDELIILRQGLRQCHMKLYRRHRFLSKKYKMSSPPQDKPEIQVLSQNPGQLYPPANQQPGYSLFSFRNSKQYSNSPINGERNGLPNYPAVNYTSQPSSQPAPETSYMMAPVPFGTHSQPITCMNCKKKGMSRVTAENGTMVFVSAAVCCFCVCLGCIPFMIDSLKDHNHFCQHCNAFAGVKKAM
jgi:LITAF-like zinc ribbon domain